MTDPREVISTVLIAATATAPANPYDLTDLATAKDELGLKTADTTNDAFLSRAITQVSSAISKHCNRVFQVEAIQDVLYYRHKRRMDKVHAGSQRLQLARWPLVNTSVVSFSGDTHGTTTIDNIASTAGLVVGQLVFGPGILPSTAIAPGGITANSITLSRAATASAPGGSFTTGISVVQVLDSETTVTLAAGTDFTIDTENGCLIRLNPDGGAPVDWRGEPVTVQYQAGYPEIPADLVEATLRLVTGRFRAKARDPYLKSIDQPGGIGRQEYWVPNNPTGAFLDQVSEIIENYRVPVLG